MRKLVLLVVLIVGAALGVAAAIAAVSSITLTGNNLACQNGTSSVAASGTSTLADGQTISCSASATPPAVLLGDQALAPSADSNAAGVAQAFTYTASTTGTTTDAQVYVDTGSTATKLIAGVYAESVGKPAALIASGSLNSPTAAAWNDVPLTSGAVTAGQHYWIALLGTGGTLKYRDTFTSGTGSYVNSTSGLTALPTTYSPGNFYNVSPASAYVNGAATTTTSSSSTTTTTTSTSTTSTTSTTPPPSGSGPTSTSSPTIAWNIGQAASTNTEGQTINVSTGGWSPAPTSFAYQWQDCDSTATTCTNIPGETAPIYTLHHSDVSQYVRAQVTATDADGSTTAATGLTGQIAASGGTTYYVANGGSDSNAGTSKAAPWAHAPGMTGCSGVCSTHTAHAGDQIIFKGGDTWDYTGVNGASAGLAWTWGQSGSAGARDYVGVDRSWFDGGFFSRAKLSGDNPLSTGAPASCARSLGSTPALRDTANYVTFDGLEFLGFCSPNSSVQVNVLNINGGTTNVKLLSSYFHGWTVASPNTRGQNLALINGVSSNFTNNNEDGYDIWDGADSSPLSGTAIYGDCFDLNHSIIRYENNISCDNGHILDDNLFEQINQDSGGDHGNGFEANSEATSGDSYYYNNVFRNIGVIAGVVNFWIAPTLNGRTNTDYFYNNVFYNINSDTGGNYIDCDTCSAKANAYNNTLEHATNMATDSWGTVANNNFVTSGSTPPGFGSPITFGNYEASASSEAQGGAGYTAANQYAPTAAYHPTSGVATNETALCSSLPGLCADTTQAVSLSTAGGTDNVISPTRYAQPRPASGPWDAGAYNSP